LVALTGPAAAQRPVVAGRDARASPAVQRWSADPLSGAPPA
jgi:hypothetical protein